MPTHFLNATKEENRIYTWLKKRRAFDRERQKLAEPRNRDLRARKRREAIRLMGGKCQRCGYHKDSRALQFDHRKGIRCHNSKRRFYGEDTLSVTLKILGGQRGKYQLLCANCNIIKQYERGEFGNYKLRFQPRSARSIFSRPCIRVHRSSVVARW